MLNFKSYEEAVEFNKNNYPVQTRIVLFEKSSPEISLRNYNKFCKEILFKPWVSKEESLNILEERRKRIVELTKISELKEDGNSEFLRVTSHNKNEERQKNDDSDWLVICELF
jgi:hypothetical protein